MRKRVLLGGVAAAAVLLFSGAAFSGGDITTEDLLQDFDSQTHILWGYPQGQQNPSQYLHSVLTEHLAADLSRFHPPSPCFPLAIAWNLTVEFDKIFHVQSTAVFEALLTVMSTDQCSATVTSTNGQPNPLVQIAPSAP
jgi:hypothetical protein